MSHHELGIELEGALEFALGVFVLPGAEVERAEKDMGICVVRIGCKISLDTGDGPGSLLSLDQKIRQRA